MSRLFPELTEASGPVGGNRVDVDEPSKDARNATKPEIVRVKLGAAGEIIRAGAQGLQTWRKLLGMDALAPQDARLGLADAVVQLSDGRIELALEGAAFSRIVVHLLPSLRDDPDTLMISVGLQGEVPNRAVQQVLMFIQRRLFTAPYRSLLKVFQRDPDAQRDVSATVLSPEGHGDIEEVFRRSVVRSPDSEIAWRIFQAELEQQRNYHHHFQGPLLMIRHEDQECCYATPAISEELPSFFNYSLIHHHRVGEGTADSQDRPHAGRHESDSDREPGSEPRPKEHQPPTWGELFTDLRESDVISGGTQRVEELLDAVGKLTAGPEVVIVKNSCVPKVIGDDLQPLLDRFEAASGIPTLMLDNLTDQHADVFSILIERLRLDPTFREPVDPERRVNLVGFPQSGEMRRLVSVLERLGAVINAQLVPEIQLSEITRYPQAELQVFYDSDLYRSSFELILASSDVRSLYTVPPFGMAGSRAWLEQVADTLGLAADLAGEWERAWAPYADQWAKIQDRAAGHRLGFVLDRHAIELLKTPAKSTGVPVLATVREMGFELEFLLYGDVEADHELDGECYRFNDAPELEARLRDSRAEAFYSELYYDRRLTRCGKAQFSVSDFALGLAGALQTAQHLLRVCELPFYRKYGAHMGAPFSKASP